jgi:DNA repair protein RecO (recombination protein O)
MWRVVAELGFAPALTVCASCHAELPPEAAVTFHHRAGGALCAGCARSAVGGRTLPAAVRLVLTGWLADADARGPGIESPGELRAHQRLLREFLEEHLGDGRPLRAFLGWEEMGMDGQVAGPRAR